MTIVDNLGESFHFEVGPDGNIERFKLAMTSLVEISPGSMILRKRGEQGALPDHSTFRELGIVHGDVLDLERRGDAMGLEARGRDDDAPGQKTDADTREDDGGRNKGGLGKAGKEMKVTKCWKEGEQQTAKICLTELQNVDLIQL